MPTLNATMLSMNVHKNLVIDPVDHHTQIWTADGTYDFSAYVNGVWYNNIGLVLPVASGVALPFTSATGHIITLTTLSTITNVSDVLGAIFHPTEDINLLTIVHRSDGFYDFIMNVNDGVGNYNAYHSSNTSTTVLQEDNFVFTAEGLADVSLASQKDFDFSASINGIVNSIFDSSNILYDGVPI